MRSCCKQYKLAVGGKVSAEVVQELGLLNQVDPDDAEVCGQLALLTFDSFPLLFTCTPFFSRTLLACVLLLLLAVCDASVLNDSLA